MASRTCAVTLLLVAFSVELPLPPCCCVVYLWRNRVYVSPKNKTDPWGGNGKHMMEIKRNKFRGSVNAAAEDLKIGRGLRIVDFRRDGFGLTFDLLPTWAVRQVKEWFPGLGMHIPGPSNVPARGSEESPSTDHRTDGLGSAGEFVIRPAETPSVHLTGDDLSANSASGIRNLVLIPRGGGSQGRDACTNTPPLGATCDEVRKFESCGLPMIAANNICDKTCGRCQAPNLSISYPSADNGGSGISADPVQVDDKGESGEHPPRGNDNSPGECQTLADFMASRSDLGLTASLFQAAEQPLLKAVLGDSFVGTFFIPNDAAFQEMSATIGLPREQILAANPSFWEQVLDALVVPGLPRRQFHAGQEFPTLSARWDIFVENDDFGEIKLVSQSGFKASIVEQDITACSSVVHVINNVLVPITKQSAVAEITKQLDPSATG